MVKLGLLLLRLIVHTVNLARLLAQKALLLVVGNLLVLLHLVAWLATTCAKAVGAGVTREVVFGADVASVDHGEDERDAETAEAKEGEALDKY
jgi:hypothetical protein